MAAKVDTSICGGCESCVGACPVNAISMENGVAVISDECIECGACVGECPCNAISLYFFKRERKRRSFLQERLFLCRKHRREFNFAVTVRI